MSAVGNPLPVLQTKLYRPRTTQDYVRRSRLNDRLKQIERHPLTLVSAPAGYGKSVLLSAWLEQCSCPGAWLSLDENDNDLGTFESYFLAALRSAIPSFGDGLLDLLDSTSLPPTRTFVEMLFTELSRLDEGMFLMIDDYGVITNDAVHAFISKLMRHPHPNLHLVLITRYAPPLPLNEWRANSQLVEIRNFELRFSLEETRSFLQQAIDAPLDEKTIAALHEKTEGWAAGLRLAALSFSRIEEFQGQIDRLSGSNMYIRDYLVSQVLVHLPAEKQLFLLQTSILDRFCASLCQAVIMLDSPLLDAQVTLQELEATNVFTIPLDDSGTWFRYHHLFDEFLQMRLREGYSAEVLAALHVRASAWFAEHGFIEEALKHALTAGEMEASIQIVAANRQELMNEEHFQRLWRWLQQFPQHIIEESPDLLLIQARSAQIQRFDMAEVSRIADKVDALVNTLPLEPQKAKRISAETGALRSASHYFALDPKTALACCSNGLEIMPRQWYALRSYCWIYGAAALQMNGDLSGAYEWIQQGRREDTEVSGGPQARNAAAEGFVSWIAADLAGLQRVAEFMLGISTDSRWHSLGWAHYFLACVHYHRNDLDSALYHAKKTFDRRYVNHALANVYSAFIMAMIQQARGKSEAALEMLALAADFANEIRSTPFILMVQSFQAELAVLQSRAHELIKWEEQACLNVQLSAMPFFYAPPLTIPKVLLAIGTPGSLVKAADCLQRLHAFAESTHNTRVLIEVLALEAMLHAANQNQQAALVALEESLALAQPGGFIRLYVDLGPKIAELLRRMQNRKLSSGYTASILSAFSDTSHIDRQLSGNKQLIEPLTERELEILDLLGKRYSNKEIAAELVISPETVKRHAINIYQKLAVHNRRDAVEVAGALGLIPPP